MYGFGFYRFDGTYILVLIGVVLSVLASSKVKSTFNKYSRVRSMAGITGAEAAERILRQSGHLRCAHRAHQRQSHRPLRSVQQGTAAVGFRVWIHFRGGHRCGGP